MDDTTLIPANERVMMKITLEIEISKMKNMVFDRINTLQLTGCCQTVNVGICQVRSTIGMEKCNGYNASNMKILLYHNNN